MEQSSSPDERLREEIRRLRDANQRLTTELQTARELRSRTREGIREYTTRLQQELSGLRKQRAWTVMLGLRKAYTLLRRPGLQGKARFGSWILKLPFAGLGNLDECDVRLPVLTNYVPPDVPEQGVAGQAKACPTSYPLVSIVIVTYNSAAFVKPCLESLRRNTRWPHYELHIVDNASTDGTVELLRQYALEDPRMHLTCLASNLGFAGANNLAVKNATGPYLALLNADIVVTPGWLARLIRLAEQDSSIGVVSPVTNFAGNEIKINAEYRNAAEMERFSSRIAREKEGRSFEVPVAPLFCTVIRRAAWEAAGGLDESFEIGMFEDDDFSERVRRQGYRIVAAEDCFIHHFGQGSFSQMDTDSYRRLFEKNRRRFEQKWQTEWQGHRTRPNVRPVDEERRFSPGEFWVE